VLVLLAILPLSAQAYKEIDILNSSFSTHQFILDKAVRILANDGYSELASLVNGTYLEEMKWGSIRADETLWDSREHYMDPNDHLGLLGFKSAGQLAKEMFSLSTSYWAERNRLDAMFNLGWSAHMVADLTVPHHARLTFLDYHSEYEQWVLAHQDEYSVESEGIYGFASYLSGHYENESDPFDWVDYNAHLSYEYFEYVNGPNGENQNDYGYAASVLLPRAQRTTAGYISMFFKTVDERPTANAGTNKIVDEDIEVLFDASNSSDDLGIVNFTWSFGDGSFGYEITQHHVYSNPGTYNVSLTVRDPFGNEDIDDLVVIVRDNTPPQADAGDDKEGDVGEPLSFSASNSTDNTGIAEFIWDFGDGSVGSGKTLSHSFEKTGTYIVTLTVEDSEGNIDMDQINVLITSRESDSLSVGNVFVAVGITLVAFISIAAYIFTRSQRKHRNS
ncbi:MAG: PKD domain-containing protein, partial [Thermoplasmata archaeon]